MLLGTGCCRKELFRCSSCFCSSQSRVAHSMRCHLSEDGNWEVAGRNCQRVCRTVRLKEFRRSVLIQITCRPFQSTCLEFENGGRYRESACFLPIGNCTDCLVESVSSNVVYKPRAYPPTMLLRLLILMRVRKPPFLMKMSSAEG